MMEGYSIEMSDQTLKLQTLDYSSEMLQKLNKSRSSGMYTDAILCVGKEEYPVHRIVLAISSPYFNAMFSSRLRESHESRIVFNEISAATLRRIIDYSYSGGLEITQDNAQELLAAGNLLEYPTIVSACCQFLQNQIHVTNTLGIENIAQLHCCEDLRSAANKFTHDNFSLVVEGDEFLDISKERLMGYISDDSIDVPKEEIVYEAVINWINNDLKIRQQYLYELLNLVRLPNIDTVYLRGIKSVDLVRGSKSCVEMVDDALLQQERGNDNCKRRSSKSMLQLHPRPSTIAKEVIVAVGGIQTSVQGKQGMVKQNMEIYDIHKNKWFYLCDIPSSVTWCSVSSVDNCIVITGGIVDGDVTTNVWVYKPNKHDWTKVSPLLKPRARHASVVLHGNLYVIGGITYSSNSTQISDVNTIECYDILTDTWSVVGKSHFPRTQSRIIAFCDAFAEVGGLQCDTTVNTIDCYVCNQQNNTVKSSGEQYLLPEAIQFAQILVLNGIYYILWEDTKKVLTLNPYKRTFCTLPEMKYSHIHSGAVVLDNKIYIVGGMVDSKASKIIECYDPLTNKWTVETTMNQSRAGLGCVTLVI